jgi:hypothetical protein
MLGRRVTRRGSPQSGISARLKTALGRKRPYGHVASNVRLPKADIGRLSQSTVIATIRRADVMECPGRDYSGLMPADLITLAHFSVSSAMNLPNSVGDAGTTEEPRSSIRDLI